MSDARSGAWFPDGPVAEEHLPGSDRGRHPFVFLAYGNGGGEAKATRRRERNSGALATTDRRLATEGAYGQIPERKPTTGRVARGYGTKSVRHRDQNPGSLEGDHIRPGRSAW